MSDSINLATATVASRETSGEKKENGDNGKNLD